MTYSFPSCKRRLHNKTDAESEGRNVLKISNVMAKNIRRAAKKAINSRGSHRLLGLVVFDEKIVCESLKKTASARANGEVVYYYYILRD